MALPARWPYVWGQLHGLYRFIIDFASLEPKLAIELDGPIHERIQEYNAIRQEYIELMEFQVLRFTNDQVFGDLYTVLGTIRDAVIALRSPAE